MAMDKKGLTKLVEECSELSQIAAKKMAYMDTDTHPDGNGSMNLRLEEEMADVLASIQFVSNKFGLSFEHISSRSKIKFLRFCEWDEQP